MLLDIKRQKSLCPIKTKNYIYNLDATKHFICLLISLFNCLWGNKNPLIEYVEQAQPTLQAS